MPQPRSRSTDKRFYGVAEGIVTEIDDPAQEGRVKVRFPWFDDEMVSEWCRVRQLYAGGGYGTFFVPEEGDEVLVAFIHGDMRLPVVLGGLYNGEDKPSTHRSSSKDEKVIRTRGGHELLFDDQAGDERLHLKTPGEHQLELSDKDRKVTLESTGGHRVVIDDAASKVTLETSTGTSITLDGTSGSVTIKGTASVTVDAPSVALGGPAATQPLVLGTAMLALFNAHTHTLIPPTGTTSPPITPMTPANLSTKVRTV